MTKISQYSTDVNITGNDKWIGSDAQNYLITKNFTPNNLANYFNGNNVIDIGTSIRYMYQTLDPGEAREQGTISFETEIGPQVNFSDITTFLIAKNTLKGNTVSQYLDFLVDGKVILSKASNINVFGYYKITSLEPWIPNTNFFVVTVDFLAGNGFIYEDLDYLVSLVDKVQDIPPPVWGSITGDIEDQTDLINYIASQIITPTLSEVLGAGNTTDGNLISISDGDYIVLDNGSKLKKGTTDSGNGGLGGIALKCSVDYELKWDAGRLFVMQQDGFTIRETLYNFNITPSGFDDSTKGYEIGSRWVLDDGSVYLCTDNIANAAIWELQLTDAQNLQQVTDIGSITTNTITVGSLSGLFSQILSSAIGAENYTTGTYAYLDSSGYLGLNNGAVESYLKNTNVTNAGVILEFPNKPTGSYTIATTVDVPTTPTLQQVTDVGNTSTNDIIIQGANDFIGQISPQVVTSYNTVTGAYAEMFVGTSAQLSLSGGTSTGILSVNNIISSNVQLEFPNKTTGTYTIATTADITTPTLQQVLDNNHDLTNGNNFQGTGAGVFNTGNQVIGFGTSTLSSNSGVSVNAFGVQALQANTANHVNGFGQEVGASNTYKNVNLFGYRAYADANNQTVFSKWISGSTTYLGRLSFNNITDARKWEFPDASGTLALTSDIPSITPAALTKTNDTNVTLTLGGSPSTALLQGVSLTLGWTGTLADSRIASATNWNTAYNNRITSLTTTGSGAATLISNVLNIPTPPSATFTSLTTIGSSGSSTLLSGVLNVPTYTLSGLGGQPLSTNLTSLSGLTYASASFVKMTAAGTFALDTNTYLTSAVTSVGATGPITSSGGNTPTISTSMSTNKLIGRSTAGTGVMEEITVGTGLSLSGGTLTASGASPLTTKGDLYTFNSTNARLPVGLDTQILIADSTTSTGLKWGTNTAATPTGYYAQYQDVLTQTVAVINTGYPIKFRTLDLSNGVTVVSDSRITFANTGIYNLQFSVQLQNADTQEHDVTIWLRKNGVDVVGSAGFVGASSKHGGVNGHSLPSWNYLLDVIAGEYYELVWSATSTQVTMQFYPAGSPPPSTASAIFTVTQQSGIMAGTGMTSLTTTGSSGTATYNSVTGALNIPQYMSASTRRNANNSSNNNINYNGVALGTGVSESSAVWTITRLTIAASGSITTATATNVAWTNRQSATYI